jgi:hypothetical protein
MKARAKTPIAIEAAKKPVLRFLSAWRLSMDTELYTARSMAIAVKSRAR